MKKIVLIVEEVLQLFVSFSALVSGVFMMASPGGTLMRMPLSMLKGSPFVGFHHGKEQGLAKPPRPDKKQICLVPFDFS